MNILGIGGVLGNAAAALLKDGQIVSAIEESKVDRRAQAGRLPDAAIKAGLKLAGLAPGDIDFVAVARPLPQGSELPVALRAYPKARVILVDHHEAHAASAFFVSPFQEATVITLDRFGDVRCGSKWRGEGNRLTLEEEILYPDSIAELYGRVTELLGFHSRSDEHRVQWLAPTGEPRFHGVFEEMIQDRRIDQSFFDTGRQGKGGFGSKFFDRIGISESAKLAPEERADLAATVQKALENYVVRLAGDGGQVCLAGGIGWNALLVEALERSGRGVFAQPAAGNAGTALGAALQVWNGLLGNSSRADAGNYCLGPAFTPEEIKQVLENCKLRFHLLATQTEIINNTVERLGENQIVAWMQGRMEFGPRALGNRSILASPQDPYSAENLNTFIKHRESSRKFAASVPAELASQYFEVGPNARYLSTVGRVRPEYADRFRTATLAKDLLRVHAVSQEDNPLYWKLLHSFGEKTGLPVLYNTSFNLFGEPLVCTPRDAVRSFYSSGVDAMVVGNFLLEK